MSKLKKVFFGICLLGIASTPFFLANNSGAQASIYMDYSTLDSVISNDYASSKIYYTPDTKITVKKVGRNDDSTGGIIKDHSYIVEPGRELVILVENSTARDSSGAPADVIWRINNVHEYTNVTTKSDGRDMSAARRDFSFSLRSTDCGSSVSFPDGDDCLAEGSFYRLGVNDPISFWISSNFSYGNFTVQYIKKGSFNNATMTGTPADISKLAYMGYDFDMPSDYNIPEDAAFNGDEGVIVEPTSPSRTTFYYHKYQQVTDTTMYGRGNGIAVSALGLGHDVSFRGIYYGGSYFGLVDDMKDSSYTFKYTTASAAASFFFGSPVAYDTPAPSEYVLDDEGEGAATNRVTTNTEFNYYIRQDVPQVFSSSNDITGYMSLWSKYSNIKRDHNYSNFSIRDNIDANLILPSNTDVTVVRLDNGVETDVTDDFDVTISDQTIVARAKFAALTQADFYGKSYIITIPVKTKNVLASKQIQNRATVVYAYTNLMGRNKSSNTVTTDTYHKLTVRHIDKETGKEIADTTTEEYDHGYEYETEKASELPTGYQLIGTPENATGILNSDVTVTYYYDIPKNPSTLDRDLMPFAAALGGAAIVATGLFFVVSKRR